MKKSVWICLIVLVGLLLLGGIVWGVVKLTPPKVEPFALEDYRVYLENESFRVDMMLGPTETAEDAREKAQEVWVEIYGERVKRQKPYHVYFDDRNDVWLVEGSLPFEWLPLDWNGGTACILIQKSDGRVLAVWHGK